MSFEKDDPRFWGGSKLADNVRSVPTVFQVVKLRIHHGGVFVKEPVVTYVRGQLHEMHDGWDVDHISAIEVGKYVKSLGYATVNALWYRHPSLDLDSGLRSLNNDKDVIQFLTDVNGSEWVDIFVEHPVDAHVRVVREDARHEIDVGELQDTPSEFEDEEYMANSDEDSESEVSLDDSDYDEGWDWWTNLLDVTVEYEKTVAPCILGGNVGQVGEDLTVRPASSSRNVAPTSATDFLDEDGASSDLDTPPENDEEESPRARYPKFKMPEGEGKVKFEIGMTFTCATLVRDAVKEYALREKKNVYMSKNDKNRIVIKCMKECPFYVRVSKTPSSSYFQVVTAVTDHTCHRTAKNRQAKPKLLSRKFIPTLRHTPNYKSKALVEDSKEKWGVHLSRFQAYRAKRKAIELIEGSVAEQYTNLRSYAEELKRSNPGSTIIIKCTAGKKGPVFERIYVCFQACKAAFVTYCRPLIGLDGCFLKGFYGGQLLTAVGKDGNNQMLPIAFAIVEAETKDAWGWFMELLLQDLDGIEKKRWSFISDQQKGLVPTLQCISEHVEHRLCVKHLYGNWRKKYPGSDMKEAMWMAARATTVPEHEKAMEHLKSLNEQAWQDMKELPPGMWTRSAYYTYSQCDLQVNNMCEAFNRAILEYRDKPIISLVEGLKFYICERFVTLRDIMLRYKGTICPMIQRTLEKIKRDADGWTPHWSGDESYSLFEVKRGQHKYVVDLGKLSCACRKWDLTGLPCCHAVACLWSNNYRPEDYVAACYSKQTFLNTYSHIIMPCNGPKLWPIIDSEPINPPYMRRAPGRPKKQRRKTNDEPKNPHKLRRKIKTVRCTICGKQGHNKATCKGKSAADKVIPKGGNKANTQVEHPAQGDATTSRKNVRRNARKNAASLAATGNEQQSQASTITIQASQGPSQSSNGTAQTSQRPSQV